MKTLHKRLIPLWVYLLIFAITIFCSLIAINGSAIPGTIFSIILNGAVFFAFFMIERKEKLKSDSLSKDPFFTQENYTLGSGGIYTILAIGKEKLCVVNVKSTILINKRHYNIVEIYKNYPDKDWKEIKLLGNIANYLEIPTEQISSVHPINQGEAGWQFLAKKMNFGIRLKMKNDDVIDIDTTFPAEFCEEISAYLTK